MEQLNSIIVPEPTENRTNLENIIFYYIDFIPDIIELDTSDFTVYISSLYIFCITQQTEFSVKQ